MNIRFNKKIKLLFAALCIAASSCAEVESDRSAAENPAEQPGGDSIALIPTHNPQPIGARAFATAAKGLFGVSNVSCINLSFLMATNLLSFQMVENRVTLSTFNQVIPYHDMKYRNDVSYPLTSADYPADTLARDRLEMLLALGKALLTRECSAVYTTRYAMSGVASPANIYISAAVKDCFDNASCPVSARTRKVQVPTDRDRGNESLSLALQKAYRTALDAKYTTANSRMLKHLALKQLRGALAPFSLKQANKAGELTNQKKGGI